MSYSGKFKDKNNNLHPVTSVLYGTCDTAAATAAKVVACTDFDAFMTGVTIRVKFTNANTAASPTVNINSTGAKSVYRFGSTTPVDGNSWNAGEVVELVYDGTSFFMTGADDIAAKQNATDNSLNTEDKTIVGAINEHEGDIGSLKSGLTNLLKYKIFNEVATDTTNHLYSTGVNCNQYVCVGGCTPYNPNFMIQISNIEVTTDGYIRYRLYDIANNQIVSDNAAYTVELVFVDMSMLSELVITP